MSRVIEASRLARDYMRKCMGMSAADSDQEQNFILGHLVTFALRYASARATARLRLHRERCMARGVCVNCGKPKGEAREDQTRCLACAAKHSANTQRSKARRAVKAAQGRAA